MVSVKNPKDTRILYVSVVSDDPQEAKDMADTYAQVAREFIAVKMDTEQPNIFEEALLPSGPSSPNKSKNVIMGFMIGLILSCGVIVAQFLMDDRLRSEMCIRDRGHSPPSGENSFLSTVCSPCRLCSAGAVADVKFDPEIQCRAGRPFPDRTSFGAPDNHPSCGTGGW